MAAAEAYLAPPFNRPEHESIDHFTHMLSGDECLMEAAALNACRVVRIVVKRALNKISVNN
jgi:transketolase